MNNCDETYWKETYLVENYSQSDKNNGSHLMVSTTINDPDISLSQHAIVNFQNQEIPVEINDSMNRSQQC